MSLEYVDTTNKNREWYDFWKLPFPEFLKEADKINSDYRKRIECIKSWEMEWQYDEFDKLISSEEGVIIDWVKYQLIYREENNQFYWIVDWEIICSVKAKTKMLPDNSDGNRIRRKYLEFRKKYIEMLELDKKIKEKKEKFFEEKIKDFWKEKWNEIAKKRIWLISFISHEYGLWFINFSNSFVQLEIKPWIIVVTYWWKTAIISLKGKEIFDNLRK